jgi:DNA replication protein DnaC
MKTVTCGCLKSFSYEPVPHPSYPDREVFARTVCPECEADDEKDRESREAAATLAERERTWKFLCPRDYAATLPRRLPQPQLLQTVLAWKFGPRGLVLVGPTQRGKTRCAWELARREFFQGRYVKCVTAYDLAAYPAKVYHDSGGAAKWIEIAASADLLILDDVFKAKPTDRAEEALFCIVEERTSRGRPIVATLNDSPATLKARLSQDRGEPLVRRLVEFCELIECL